MRAVHGSLAPEEAPCLFVERKTHHDKLSGQSSVKTRMPLAPEQASAFLAGRPLDLAAMCTASAARRELPATEAAAAAALGAEWQAAAIERRLSPKVRTVFRRVAFSSASSAATALRITLDTQMSLLREPPPAAAAVPTPGGAWCARLSDSVTC